MSWVLCAVLAVLAAVLGYLGGVVAVRRDRHRREVTAAAPRQAAFAMEHIDGQTWSVTNTGNAPAMVVHLVPLSDGVEHWPPQPAPDAPATATSERLPTLEPGGSLSIWLSRHEPGQQVLVSWTSEANVRMGPVTLDVPAPQQNPTVAGF